MNGLYIAGAVAATLLFAPSLMAIGAFGPLWKHRPVACLSWIVLAPTVMFMKLLTVVLSPLLAFVSMFTGANLPYFLLWFQTHDEVLDAYARTEGVPEATNTFTKWYYRVLWLCRNPAYGYMQRIGKNVEIILTYKQEVYLDNFLEFRSDGMHGWERTYIDEAVSARGALGPFGVWFGWKIVRARPDVLNEKRVMFAIGLKVQ